MNKAKHLIGAAGKAFTRDRKHSMAQAAFWGLLIAQVVIIGGIAQALNSIYVHEMPCSLGNQDVTLTKSASNQFQGIHFESGLLEDLEGEVPGLSFLPRLYSIASIGKTAPEAGEDEMLVVGIDFERENQLQARLRNARASTSIGELRELDENHNRMSKSFTDELPPGYCLLTKSTAEILNATVGELIDVELVSGVIPIRVYRIVDNEGRFPDVNTNLIITPLAWLQYVLSLDQVNVAVGFFEHPEKVYNVLDIDATSRNLGQISNKILEIAGDDFNIFFPRALSMRLSQGELVAMMLIIFAFFYILTVMCALVAYLSGSKWTKAQIEDDIHHAGSLSRRDILGVQALKILITWGLALLIGLSGGGLINYFLIQIPVTAGFLLEISLFSTIVLCFALMPLVHRSSQGKQKNRFPERSREDETNYRQESFPLRKRPLLIGGIITLSTILVFLLLPSMIMRGLSIEASLFVFLVVMTIILGLALICAALASQLGCWIRNYSQKVSRKKYDSSSPHSHSHVRRRIYQPLIFATCFTLLVLVAAAQQLRNRTLINQIYFEEGGEVVVKNAGTPDGKDFTNVSFFRHLAGTPGVQSVAPVLYNFKHASSELSLTIESDLEQHTGSESFDFMQILDPEKAESSNSSFHKPKTYLANSGDERVHSCGLIGINESFLEVIDTSLVSWDPESNSSSFSFERLFNTQNSCIISKSLAQSLRIVQEDIVILRLLFANHATYYPLKVVGISVGMPGFVNFYTQSPFNNAIPGVLVNIEDYLQYAGYNIIDNSTLPFDRFLVKLSEQTEDSVSNFKTRVLNDLKPTYAFLLSDPVSKVNYLVSGSGKVSWNIEILLIVGTVLCSIGLSVGMIHNYRGEKRRYTLLAQIEPSNRRSLRASLSEDASTNILIFLLSTLTGWGMSVFIFSVLSTIMGVPTVIDLDYAMFGMNLAILGTGLFISNLFSFLRTKSVKSGQITKMGGDIF